MEPTFEELSVEGAIQLFKEWGFLVEQGPRTEEVTLILQGRAHRSCHVFETALLPKLAVAALQVRWCNGVILRHLQDVQ